MCLERWQCVVIYCRWFECLIDRDLVVEKTSFDVMCTVSDCLPGFGVCMCA